MRSTVEIDEKLLKHAMDLTNVRTKRGVVNLALEELVRARSIERLIAKGGSGCVTMTLKELERLRELE